MLFEQPVQYASVSDIGFRRQDNEDAAVVQLCTDRAIWSHRGHFFMVADGMGGHAVGELASKIATDTAPHTFFKCRAADAPTALRSALETANAAIHERGSQNVDFARMGTTGTALVLGPDGATIGHVGDSRVYRIRGDRVDQLTCDHSLQWELIRHGRSKPEEVFLHEPRHVITRSLGPEPRVEVDIEGPYPVLPGDVFVLCSDGLSGHVEDAELGVIARELPPPEACRLLVHLANLRGGSDNITVVVVRVGAAPDGASPSRRRNDPEQVPDWRWLVAFTVLAGMMALGICLTLLDHRSLGWSLVGLSTVAILFFVALWRKRFAPRPVTSGLPDTVLWRPYRTTQARLTKRFLSRLAAIEAALHRTAAEERWSIDWPSYDEATRQAKQALQAGDLSKVLRAYARAIDLLMAGLTSARNRLHYETRWRKVLGGGGTRTTRG